MKEEIRKAFTDAIKKWSQLSYCRKRYKGWISDCAMCDVHLDCIECPLGNIKTFCCNNLYDTYSKDKTKNNARNVLIYIIEKYKEEI